MANTTKAGPAAQFEKELAALKEMGKPDPLTGDKWNLRCLAAVRKAAAVVHELGDLATAPVQRIRELVHELDYVHRTSPGSASAVETLQDLESQLGSPELLAERLTQPAASVYDSTPRSEIDYSGFGGWLS